MTFRDKATYESCRSFELREGRAAASRHDLCADIWNRIVASAHKYAEPGVAFIDEVIAITT